LILFDSVLDKTSVKNISIWELHKQGCLNRELILLKYTLNWVCTCITVWWNH
jgi:hypothetical protein